MIRPLALLLSVLLITPEVHAQQSAEKRSLQSVFATNGSFDKLTGKAARAGTWESTSGEATALVIGLADKIAAYLDETGRIGEITETPQDQMVSPFTAAVMSGMAEIVAIYLRYPDVRARLNEPLEFHSIKGDRHLKAHAWAIAAAAPLHSVSFCGGELSALFFGYDGLATYLEARPGETPYRRVLAALEAAGAKPQPEEARAVWRIICGGDDRPGDGKWSDTARKLNYEAALVPGSRERVLKAPQMLDAIEAELRTLQSLRAEGKVPVVVLPKLSD